MAEDHGKVAQVHVRVALDLKKAVKMYCVREGITEQTWIHGLIEAELSRRAPDLWRSKVARSGARGVGTK